MKSKRSSGWSSKGWQANAGWKPGPLSIEGSRSSQEQWSKETPKGTKLKEITKVQYETGLFVKERKATWHKCCRESQQREEDLLIRAEELRTQGCKDERDRTVLVNGFRRINEIREEEEEQKQKSCGKRRGPRKTNYGVRRRHGQDRRKDMAAESRE